MADGFDLRAFNGLSPRTSPRLLRDSMATIAENAYLLHGDVEPSRLPLDAGVAVLAGTQSIYRHCGQWLQYPGKVYFAQRVMPGDTGGRLYIAGHGAPMVRGCDGVAYQLGIVKPAFPPVVAASATDYGAYTYRFAGFYEGADGGMYDKASIVPAVVDAGKEYAFVPFARTAAPAESEFGVSVEVSKGGELLGIAYSSNTYRAGNSDLYLNGNQVIASLFDRSSGTDTAYDDGKANPSLMALKLSYSAASSASLTRAYAYTYVTAWGEESQPSDASDLVLVEAGNDVAVSGFVPSPHGNVDRVRLYRTDSGGQYRFVAEFPDTQASYTDNKLDTELGEVLPSASWLAPPDGLQGIVGMPNGFMAGFVGNVLWFSEVNQPHAWPAEYTLTKIDGDIVGICGAFENSLVVVTTKHPYIVTGYSPDAMTATKVGAYEPCLSALSIVDMGVYGVGYASANGFVVVRAGSAEVFTEELITPEQWRGHSPQAMRSGWHKGRLHVVSGLVHFVLHMRGGDDILTTESNFPTALWMDTDTDTLWTAGDGRLWKHGQGMKAVMDWLSGETQYQRPVSFVRAKVEAESHPVTLKLWADGREVFRYDTEDDEPFYLPVVPRSKHWRVGVESLFAVHRVVVTDGHVVM
ncbi:hypothetical protein VSS37_03700 [Candidatus Thiothrix sp. Deng01]|uniref:Uncharacterized protein n=1 Tax=Candidatus Thiothrix phosphatis TaxID=3112415 RepID=A0ABU6CTF1_9GAMM|nr:hypothetical protein [Candidatus Thiothrix sp. Deng01]MEB4590075.1 hypothetical protein [Candidatus Thiothrix sp. Deng01]